MIEKRSTEEIETWAAELVRAHGGSVSAKTIRGVVRYYLQWKEDGRYRSKYLRATEVAAVRRQLALLRGKSVSVEASPSEKASASDSAFETNVCLGRELLEFAKEASGFLTRDEFPRLEAFIRSPRASKVFVIYGLRRTGKTTMIRQSILSLNPDACAHAAYIKVGQGDTLASLNRDLKRLHARGIDLVYIDEVTLLGNFIDSASLFSDVHAAVGMKVVLSGTDSLGFWLAAREELYDRVEFLHTTFIPFREHARLLGTDDIDEYIEYGGTFKIGERRFGHPDARRDEASFRDDESTRFYIDTAIARNIQHSLKGLESGGHFRHLKELYEAGELTDAINRVVEDINHRFVVDVLTRRFKSHDLGSAADLLMKSPDADRALDVYASIDVQAVTERLKEILDIKERESRTIGVTDVHAREIREYLLALDLLMPVEIRSEDGAPYSRDAFLQPGLRYAQAQALVFALGREDGFNRLAGRKAKVLVDCILDDVRGRMLEDIVLVETRLALPSSNNPFAGFGVFKLQFASGEFDMVVCDNEKRQCRLFEIKHSGEVVEAQMRHLADEAKLLFVRERYGDVVERTVLYRGAEAEVPGGIRYRNANAYLKDLVDVKESMSRKGNENGNESRA